MKKKATGTEKMFIKRRNSIECKLFTSSGRQIVVVIGKRRKRMEMTWKMKIDIDEAVHKRHIRGEME